MRRHLLPDAAATRGVAIAARLQEPARSPHPLPAFVTVCAVDVRSRPDVMICTGADRMFRAADKPHAQNTPRTIGFLLASGSQGRLRTGALRYVRLQPARRCDEARQGRGQASHDAILEYNHTRIFRDGRTEGSRLP